MGSNILHASVQRQFTKYSLIGNKAACRIPSFYSFLFFFFFFAISFFSFFEILPLV